MNASIKLKVKFGLLHDPTDEEIGRWEQETRRLIDTSDDPEEAGRAAALIVFGNEVERLFYGSEADTIEAMLKLLAKK